MKTKKAAPPPYKTSYGLFGIVNPHGHFWSHQTFFTPEEARSYIASFWKGRPASDLDKFRVVPVRITLEFDDEATPAAIEALPVREG